MPNKKKASPSASRHGRFFVMLSLTAAVVLTTAGAAGGQLLEAGRSFGLLSVGLMQPEGGAQALSERLERIPAKQGGVPGASSDDHGFSYSTGGGLQTSAAAAAVEAALPGGDAPVPPEKGDGGKVVEEKLSPGSSFIQNVAVKNNSSRAIDAAEFLKTPPDLGLVKTAAPQVLIMHTHTTECYMTYFAGYYNQSDATRSLDTAKGVGAVGEAVAAQLRTAGIGVIHDLTVHDYPKYDGSYSRSEETVKKLLQQYPTISVVLDIHRDAIQRGTTKVKPTVTVDGRKAAQVMLVASAGNTKTLPHPDWEQNMRLAVRLQGALYQQYGGLVRPMYVVDSRYNQHLTHGSLLLEIGSDSNTIDEAVYSGEMVGKMLSQVLNSLIS